MSWYLLLPFAAAIIYAVASVILKRALQEGATTDQIFHYTNLCIALVFGPLIFFERNAVDWSQLWQPAIVATFFLLGNLTTFIAIKKGDVSVVTPLMGTKVVFVAIGALFLTGKAPTPALWLAAILTSLGIFTMGVSELRKKSSQIGFAAIFIALTSAVLFAFHDVLVARWAKNFGGMTFLALSMMGLSVASLVVWLCQGRPILRMPDRALKFGLLGGILIGIQAVMMGLSLSFFDDATRINVVFASRGLWVLAVVAFLGNLFGNNERMSSGSAFRWRIIGTILVTVAVVLAVLEKVD